MMDHAPGPAPSREELDRLVVAARNGCPESLERLLYFCRGAVYQFAHRHFPQNLRSVGDSWDLVQDTYLRALESFPDFHGDTMAEFEDWLRQTERTALDVLRKYHSAKRRDYRRRGGLGDHLGDWPDPAPTPADAVAGHEDAERLQAAIARLPTELAQLVLWYNEGMSRRQIAEYLGVSLSAVHRLRLQALLLLKLLLEVPECVAG